MAINLGILGLAHGHVDMYLSQWRAHPEWGVTPVAAWDHDAARLAGAAQKHQLAPVADPAALLARADIPAVIIAAETVRHVDLIEQAAAAGKAIIVQKPLALTLPEADRIVAAVDRTGVPFTLAWQMRTDPQNLKIKELLASGALGRIFMVRRRHGLAMCLNPASVNLWHFHADKNRDIWADDAAHPIDFIYWLFGAPATITAEVETLCNPQMPMDNGIAIFRYPGGPLVEVVCSFCNVASENTVEIVGEKGSLVLNYGDVPSCNVPRPAGAIGLKWFLAGAKDWTYSDVPSPTGHGARISGLAQPLADFLQGRRPPIATAQEGRSVLRMTLGCYVSLRNGRRIAFDDPAIAHV